MFAWQVPGHEESWRVSLVILSHCFCQHVCSSSSPQFLRYKLKPQAVQSSTCTFYFFSRALVMCSECGFAMSCWKMNGRPWCPICKRCGLEGSKGCSKISGYNSAFMLQSQKWKWVLKRALRLSQFLEYLFISPQYTIPRCNGPFSMPQNLEMFALSLWTRVTWGFFFVFCFFCFKWHLWT